MNLSPKPFLFRVYKDIELVSKSLVTRSYHAPLTTFEKAVIVLEDRRYLRHCGIDVKSVIREFLKLITFRTHGGASTIEMQFVRTCTGYRQPTLKRKLYEFILAYAVCSRYRKMDVLRSYLGIVYLGSGISGSYQGAISAFDKHIDDLTINEACQLAAMMVYPRPMKPSENWNIKVQRRASYAERLIPKFARAFVIEELP